MGKLLYDPQSWEKQIANNNIIHYLIQNSDFQLGKIVKILGIQNKTIAISGSSLPILLQYVKDEDLDNFLALWDMYKKSKDDILKANWYIKKIFLECKSLEAAKVCVPEYYWKYLRDVKYTGDGSTGTRDEYCYSLLEQAQMNNILLGIRGI